VEGSKPTVFRASPENLVPEIAFSELKTMVCVNKNARFLTHFPLVFAKYRG
jgi:hypothetical protein